MYYKKRLGNKYGAQKTEYNGKKYDSKGEARLAQSIDTLIASGKIKEVENQKRFVLYGRGGQKICTHVVDFLVTMADGSIEAWEYKGVPTALWRLKYKLFRDNYPDIKYMIATINEWSYGK